MTSLVIEHLDMPESPRYVRALHAAGERAGEVLAGRTVWCAMSLPSARRPAEELRVRVDGAGPGAAAATLRVAADEPLRHVAERVEDMLDGAESAGPSLGEAEQDAYARAAVTSDELFGGAIEVDDVVVVHDALSALMIEAVRERGAHAVWRVPAGGSSRATARQASFLQLTGANPAAPFASWVYRGSDVLLQPFRSLYPTERIHDAQSELNLSIVFAIFMYGLFAVVFAAAVSWFDRWIRGLRRGPGPALFEQ